MRFNKTNKEAFASAVLSDIPEIDYITKARKLIIEEAISQLPAPLQKHIEFLKNKHIHISGCGCMYAYVPNNQYKISDQVKEKVKALHKKHVEQGDLREATYQKTLATVWNCKTVKQAKEILPEDLHKFLPDETTGANATTALTTTQLVDSIKQLKALSA